MMNSKEGMQKNASNELSQDKGVYKKRGERNRQTIIINITMMGGEKSGAKVE